MKETIAVLKDAPAYKNPFRDKAFLPDSEAQKYFTEYSLCTEADFMERELAEGNLMHVQLVAYTIVINPDRGKIFVAKRIGGEKRLKAKYSIGFGGHVDYADFDSIIETGKSPIYSCALRELEEELNIRKKNHELIHLGYIRDLTSNTPDHIGSVYCLLAGAVSLREKDTFEEAKFSSLEEIRDNNYLGFESWSRYIYDYIYEHPEFRKMLGFKEEGAK